MCDDAKKKPDTAAMLEEAGLERAPRVVVPRPTGNVLRMQRKQSGDLSDDPTDNPVKPDAPIKSAR